MRRSVSSTSFHDIPLRQGLCSLCLPLCIRREPLTVQARGSQRTQKEGPLRTRRLLVTINRTTMISFSTDQKYPGVFLLHRFFQIGHCRDQRGIPLLNLATQNIHAF